MANVPSSATMHMYTGKGNALSNLSPVCQVRSFLLVSRNRGSVGYSNCPYCGFSYQNVKAHQEKCPHSPEMWRLTEKALDDGTGTIRRVEDYKVDHGEGLPMLALWRTFGGWPAVAKAYGLRMYPGFVVRKVKDPIDDVVGAIGEEIDRVKDGNWELRHITGSFRM